MAVCENMFDENPIAYILVRVLVRKPGRTLCASPRPDLVRHPCAASLCGTLARVTLCADGLRDIVRIRVRILVHILVRGSPGCRAEAPRAAIWPGHPCARPCADLVRSTFFEGPAKSQMLGPLCPIPALAGLGMSWALLPPPPPLLLLLLLPSSSSSCCMLLCVSLLCSCCCCCCCINSK